MTPDRERRIALAVAASVVEVHADQREDTEDPEARHWARLAETVLDVLRDFRVTLTEETDG